MSIPVSSNDYLILNVTDIGTAVKGITGPTTWYVGYRLKLGDGTTITPTAQSFTLNPRNDSGGGQIFIDFNARTLPTIQLQDGELISAVVTTDASGNNNPLYQAAAYVQLFLQRGAAFAMPNFSTLLIAETLSSEYSCAWPGNKLQKPTDGQGFCTYLVPANPGSKQTLVFEFSYQLRYRLKTVLFKLTRGAGDDAPVPYVALTNGAGAYRLVLYPPPLPAGMSVPGTAWYQFGAGLAPSFTPLGGGWAGFQQGIPTDLCVMGGGDGPHRLTIGWSGGSPQSNAFAFTEIAIGVEIWNEYD